MNLFKRITSLFRKEPVVMAGEWKGMYVYNVPLHMTDQYPRVTFTAEIIDHEGTFYGNITEDENGIPEITRITGAVTGNTINFEKTYRNLYYVDEFGRHWREEGTYVVLYTGTYNAWLKKFVGTWTIAPEDNGMGGYENKFTGHWEMSKLSLYP